MKLSYLKNPLFYLSLPILAILAYAIFIFLIAFVPVNDHKGEDLTIYISSNGVHLDIVVPANNELYDWTNAFPFSNFTQVDSSFNYVSLGWGNEDFFLNTPEWIDLKFSTAFNAVSGIGNAAMHVSYLRNIQENELCLPIKINKSNYISLVNYINDYLFFNNNQAEIIPNSKGYSYNDAFFKAKGSYNLFFTCNSWVNEALKAGGLKSCLWTIFDKPILYHYR